MSINLYTLTSSLHTEMLPDPLQESFIQQIQELAGLKFTYKGDLSSTSFSHSSDNIFYVRTGGTEGIFKSIFYSDGSIPPDPGSRVLLLSSGLSNSLAASMEILSFLNQQGVPGEILHGSAQSIACRMNELFSKADANPAIYETLRRNAVDSCNLSGSKEKLYELSQVENGNCIKVLEGCCNLLKGSRLGVIGKPSDWLISSNVDYSAAKERLGCELIDIPISEVIELFNNRSFNIGIVDKLCNNPENFNSETKSVSSCGRNDNIQDNRNGIISSAEIEKAQRVYCCLKEIVRKYELTGLTLRCFDLLDSIRTTGCLALAKLNAEGITASCEGDVPAIISMEIARKLCGTPGFQVNLSKIDGDILLFAHCSVPLNIVECYSYNTHFESGIGVAVHGEFKKGPVSIFKIGADMKHYVTIAGEITGNQYKPNLCRTQVLVKASGAADYMLESPLGNHHILVPGHLNL